MREAIGILMLVLFVVFVWAVGSMFISSRIDRCRAQCGGRDFRVHADSLWKGFTCECGEPQP